MITIRHAVAAALRAAARQAHSSDSGPNKNFARATSFAVAVSMLGLGGMASAQQAKINNIFNKTPPFTGGENLFGPANIYGGTNPIFFDTMGLAWRAGFRLNF
ncbi:MAG: hypothetical protein ACREUG_08385 [Steroidobacteraceae bacterium]